jgi:hypothetical protein
LNQCRNPQSSQHAGKGIPGKSGDDGFKSGPGDALQTGTHGVQAEDEHAQPADKQRKSDSNLYVVAKMQVEEKTDKNGNRKILAIKFEILPEIAVQHLHNQAFKKNKFCANVLPLAITMPTSFIFAQC